MYTLDNGLSKDQTLWLAQLASLFSRAKAPIKRTKIA